MRHSTLALIIVVCSSSFTALGQQATVSTISPSETPGKLVHVIVHYKNPPSLSQHQKAISGGGIIKAELEMINSGAYAVPASSLPKIAADPEVVGIGMDHPVHSLLDNTAVAVNAPTAWWVFGLDGSGVGVAVIDSGISNVDDLNLRNASGASRIVYRENFIHATSAQDYFGHGEHVSGIIAGTGADSTCGNCVRTFRGIAPGARLIDLRVLDSNGNGSDSFVIAAIQRAIQLKNVYNIRVINLSLGHPVVESYKTDPLCQAVEKAWQAGIVVVVAAGNEGRDNSFGNSGYGTINAPGNDPYVITVGAMKTMGTPQRNDDRIASYSSKGPTLVDHLVKPDIVAPGNQIVSLLAPSSTLQQLYPSNVVPLDYFQWTFSSAPSTKYFTLSGTSMAAPVVSGAAALLLQAHPGLTPDQVKARLMLTAYKKFPASSVAYEPTTGQSFTSYYDTFTVGAGYLDIRAALLDCHTFTGTALSPTAVYHPGSNGQAGMIALVCGSGTICSGTPGASNGGGAAWPNLAASDNSIWSNQSVWNNQSIWSNQAIWNNQSIWNNQAIWSNQAIWNNQSIWSNQSIWNTNISQSSDAALIRILGEH